MFFAVKLRAMAEVNAAVKASCKAALKCAQRLTQRYVVSLRRGRDGKSGDGALGFR
jgi:hypothetical protein